jgi:hypothetical protein
MGEKVFTHNLTISFTEEEFTLLKKLAEYCGIPPESLARGPIRSLIYHHKPLVTGE